MNFFELLGFYKLVDLIRPPALPPPPPAEPPKIPASPDGPVAGAVVAACICIF
jgi:hypothetical protein